MKKKTLVLAIKIVTVLLWVIALFFPNIYAETEKIEVVDYTQTNLEQTTATKMYFDVEFSKDVVKGNITMAFADSQDGNIDFAVEIPFSGNKTNVVRIEVSSDKFMQLEDIYYTVSKAKVTTTAVNVLNKVMYPVAMALAVFLIFVLRIQYKEYVVEGKKVQVYAGVLKHTVYVDNIQAYGERYLFTNKKRTLSVPLSDKIEMEVTFRANNKIETISRNRPIIENGDVVEPVVSEEGIVGSLEAAEERIKPASEESKIVGGLENADMVQTEKTEVFEAQEEPKTETTEENKSNE